MARKNSIEMYSTHNERKSSVPKSFIRALKSRIYKYMTAMWKDVYIDKLNYFVSFLEYQNIKTFLQMTMFQIDLENFWLLLKLKTLFCWHMLLVICMEKKLLERFTKNDCKKQI